MIPIFSFSLGESLLLPVINSGVAATARPVALAVLRKVLRFIFNNLLVPLLDFVHVERRSAIRQGGCNFSDMS